MTVVPPPRRLLLVGDQAWPRELLQEIAAREWDTVHCANLCEADAALASTDLLVGLVRFETLSDDACAELEDCVVRADRCEWIGIFPPGAPEQPPLRRLILEHFVAYYTRQVRPDHLCDVLGYAFDRAELRRRNGLPAGRTGRPWPGSHLEAARSRAERDAIVEALLQAHDNVSAAARRLRISRMTLYRLASKHGIALRPFGPH